MITKIKILKDIPGLKKGAIFDLSKGPVEVKDKYHTWYDVRQLVNDGWAEAIEEKNEK